MGMQEMLAGRGNPLFAELASLALREVFERFSVAVLEKG